VPLQALLAASWRQSQDAALAHSDRWAALPLVPRANRVQTSRDETCSESSSVRGARFGGIPRDHLRRHLRHAARHAAIRTRRVASSEPQDAASSRQRTERKARLPNMTSIALRPPEVAARIVPGHWEGDLIKGAMNRSSVGTLVERLSRYVMLVKLDGNAAEDILNGFRRRLKSIPESLRKTMTYDQGSEMAMHKKLSADLNMDIFFCDPHSPRQRGSNENANGLVREYLPKGMDLSQVSHQQLTAIEESINGRPRKILNWHTPQEVFSMLTLDLVRGVALKLETAQDSGCAR